MSDHQLVGIFKAY